MIFADFEEKIEFTLFGWQMLEPMALITDTILGGLSIYMGLRLKRFKTDHPFYEYWTWFFFIFGIGAIYGGLAHGFYNYWGVFGKTPAWFIGPISVYLVEQAMISAYPNKKTIKLLKGISFWKMIVVLIIWLLIVTVGPLEEKPGLGFVPIALNTIVGVSAFAGGIGWNLYKKKKISISYKYFYLGVIAMLPCAFAFLFKINLHPWFDKNDLSHVFMIAGLIYFYIGIKKLYQEGINQDKYL